MARNKYHAKKTEVDGIAFDSRLEANHYIALKALQSAGRISNLELQPEFPIIIDGKPVRGLSKRGLGRPLKAVMDFRYVRDGKVHVVDCKGVDLPLSRWKRAIVQHIYGITVEVVR